MIQTAKSGVCTYQSATNQLLIKMLGRDYTVSVLEKRITVCDNARQKEAPFLVQLCILSYLLNSKELPLSGKLVTAEKLEAGQFFFRGPHLLPTQKLEDSFGGNPDLLYTAIELFDARKKTYGDASVEIFVLSRLPLIFVIWGSDDEFKARASILFDKTASSQMPLDALMAAVTLTIKAMVETVC